MEVLQKQLVCIGGNWHLNKNLYEYATTRGHSMFGHGIGVTFHQQNASNCMASVKGGLSNVGMEETQILKAEQQLLSPNGLMIQGPTTI